MTGFFTRELPQNETLRRIGGGTLETGALENLQAFTGIETATGLLEQEARISELEEEAAGVPFEGGEMPGQDSFVVKKDAPRLSVQELNDRYGHLGMTFTEPLREETAKLLADQKREEVIRNDIASRAKGVGAVGAAFAGGLLATAVDPLEVASAFIPIVSQARTAGLVARFGAIPGRAIVGTTEGAVGAALMEPVVGGLSVHQGLDYTMSDALMNVGLGAAFGTAAGSLLGVAQRRQLVRDVSRAMNDAARDAGIEPPFGTDLTASSRPANDIVPDTVRAMSDKQKVAAFRDSIAQFIQGKDIDVSHRMPRSAAAGPEGVETLTQWIARTGGVNDEAATFVGEIAALGDRAIRGTDGKFHGKLSRQGAKRDLDMLAEQAVEEGFIRNRDVRELLDAVDRDLRGDPSVRVQDEAAFLERAGMQMNRQEAEAFLERFDLVREDLERAGISDGITPDDVIRVSEIMRRDGVTAEEAFERVSIEDAELLNQRESAPERTGAADFDASREIDNLLAEAGDVDEDLPQLQSMVEQMREAGELTDADLAELDEFANFDRKIAALERTATPAAACMAR